MDTKRWGMTQEELKMKTEEDGGKQTLHNLQKCGGQKLATNEGLGKEMFPSIWSICDLNCVYMT